MKRILLVAAVVLAPVAGFTQQAHPVVRDVVQEHILPRFHALARDSRTLADTAAQDCAPTSVPLRRAYGTAFDAWIAASHLRFGPTETDDRAFALAFWPDSRGATPRALERLIAQQDPIAQSPVAYRDMSIAARGFYALEFLLYDPAFIDTGDPAYRCTLLRTVTADIAATADAIAGDWHDSFAATLMDIGPDATYRSDEEALQVVLGALVTGLEFTADTRLGRPLGTFDRPRPNRAEARRSGRSLRHVMLSLASLRDLALRLGAGNTDLKQTLEARFDAARTQAATLDDPIFAGADDPQARLRIEVLQQTVNAIRDVVRADLGPTLGVAAGFNALDGD